MNSMGKYNKKYVVGIFSLIGVIVALIFGIFLIGVIHDIIFDFFNIPYQKSAVNSFFNSFFTGLFSVVSLGVVAGFLFVVYTVLFTIHINVPKIGDVTISTLNKLKIKH